MNLWDLIVEPMRYEFMVRALATTLIAAVVSALLSCWLVLVGWSLMGDAVSHAVLPGVVLAYIVGVPFAVGAVIFGFLAVALIGLVRDTSRVKEDAAIGIVFTVLFAIGLVLISVTPSQTDLYHIIFGNVLGISSAELIQIAILGAVVFVVLVLKRRDFTLFAFDPTHAYAIGLRPRLLGATLLALLALTAVVALQAVGVILVVAMLIIPGRDGLPVDRSFPADACTRPGDVGGVRGDRALPQLSPRYRVRGHGGDQSGRAVRPCLSVRAAARGARLAAQRSVVAST